MEPPSSWDKLTASLAVCDLSRPYRAWAFLVLQGLVRDLPGDRDHFIILIKQERKKDSTGPSVARRVASLLQNYGIALPESTEPDPEAGLSFQRFAVVRQWVDETIEPPMSGEFVYCVECGLHYEVVLNFAVCPRCQSPLPVRTATVGKPCPSCRNLNVFGAKFCEYCGQSLGAEEPTPVAVDKPEPPKPEPAKPESETWWSEVRAFRLFGISSNPKEVAQRTADLWHVLRSVIQDVAVMRAMMEERGIWEEATYKELRERQMVADHSGAGDSPWTLYSYYPYTLSETDFLKHQLKAQEEEIKEFENRVKSVERLT